MYNFCYVLSRIILTCSHPILDTDKHYLNPTYNISRLNNKAMALIIKMVFSVLFLLLTMGSTTAKPQINWLQECSALGYCGNFDCTSEYEREGYSEFIKFDDYFYFEDILSDLKDEIYCKNSLITWHFNYCNSFGVTSFIKICGKRNFIYRFIDVDLYFSYNILTVSFLH